MPHGMIEKMATCSSFSEGVKKFLGNFSPYFMGTSICEEVDTQEEEEDKEVIEDYESQVSMNSSSMKTKHQQTSRLAIRIGLVRSEP